MTRSRIVLAGALLIVLALLVAWLAIRPEMVSVDQRRVETETKGTGSPAVIFESGFTGGRLLWWSIQNNVSKSTLTLTYERAGIGRSDPGPEPRSAEQIAVELHSLLAKKAIAPPYILVGHSAGGMYVRVFAHKYPEEVAGLILVDPATEDIYERLLAQKSPDDLLRMGMPSGAVSQWRALPESIDQVRHSWPLPDVPTVIFTSGKPLGSWPLENSDDMKGLLDSHLKLAAIIPGSSHTMIANADHMSVLRDDAVTHAILGMLDNVRRRKPANNIKP